jgi:RNA polymerase sigma-B factor
MSEDLAGLDDRELLGIIGSLPRSSHRRVMACDLLVGRYRNLVWSCAARYRHSPEPTEDLIQAGYVGLLKAINRFDPAAGRDLAPYAQACVTGEIKRHFRDKRWQIHVKRSTQELTMEVRAATWTLAQELARTPAESDLARHLGISGQDLRDARLAELAFLPASLDAPRPGPGGPAGPPSLGDHRGGVGPKIEHMLSMLAVDTHWDELPPREQTILLLRFGDGMTQTQIGQQLGISQMHVSRLLAHALAYLRRRLGDVASPAVT